jgi:hypothetical protein
MIQVSHLMTTFALVLLVSMDVVGQESDASPQQRSDRASDTASQADRVAPTPNPLAASPEASAKPSLRFPVGGFKGNNAFGLPPLQLPRLEAEPLQGQAENRAAQRRPRRNFNRGQPNPRVMQPPIYVPNYNPNRPYGYPYGYSYGYPWGVYPGYGYGYGVLAPGAIGSVPGGSNFFGNPHASQYFGNPHASQGQ